YDPIKNQTRVMRSKEDAHDYRYFPDPDLAPLVISDAWRERVRATMPELPAALQARFISEHDLSQYDAEQVTASKAHAAYFEAALAAMAQGDAKMVANWMQSDLAAALNKEDLDIEQSPVSAQRLAQLLARIQDKTLSNKLAKEVFAAVWTGEHSAQADAQIDAIIDARGLKQVSDVGAIEAIIADVMANNAAAIDEYRAGKEKVFGSLVGQVMKASKGKANPAQVNELLLAKLKG
ncbi:MAG: Asp-tRNA(Asn)/Glu-tRNA(Gln) amidotransferase GatCAB subunit B, partial [Formosimonas sp.]